MPFLESYPLKAQGPRTDLSVAYLSATINNTTVTVDATKTTAGYSITRAGVGLYDVTYKKCRFLQVKPVFLPTAAGNGLVPRILAAIDSTTGTFRLELSATAAGAASEPAAADNKLELMFLSGF